jgi:hypothetical protein
LTTAPRDAYDLKQAMPPTDELDATLAKRFAWRFVRPGDAEALSALLRGLQRVEPQGEGAAGDGTPGPLPRAPADLLLDFRADDAGSAPAEGPSPPHEPRGRTGGPCADLAAAIAAAWALEEPDAGLRATRRLLARADRLGDGIAGMDAHPVESVRFVRLIVRHAPSMTRKQRDRARLIAATMSLEHPETADLIVEVARAADRDIASILLPDELGEPSGLQWAPLGEQAHVLVARLAQVVDVGPTNGARSVALDLLAAIPSREAAVLALRRAVRSADLGVRARAAHALATAQPPALAEDDVVDVLRELALHPLPGEIDDDDREEFERLLADALLLALGHVQPPEAEEALLDLIDAEHDAIWLDAGWATEALAVAYPETAAAMVDHWLKCARSGDRSRALPALERLPDVLAESRLRLAASDPALVVREAARRQWLQRFQRGCPAGFSDILGAGLLTAPPSERFAARLAVMQGRVLEARRVMARALLGEAPDPEALVLLLELVGDDSESAEPSLSPGPGAEPWAEVLVGRFGELGVRGLCALAGRFPEPESFGWMRRLGDLVERGRIVRTQFDALRDLAARHVNSEESGRVDDALRLLALVGAPPHVIDRVLVLALDDELGSSVARSLVVAWPDRSIDTRLTSAMALALASRDWTRLRNASWAALERGAPAAFVIAQRVLEVAEHEPDAVDAAIECARRLRDTGVLEGRWARAALARPESPIFVVAARAWRKEPDLRRPLEAALGSPARGGASAVHAAIALLNAEPPLPPRDRRLAAILASAVPVQRAELLHAMCMHGAPLGVVGPHLAELLVSADPDVTGRLVGVASWLRSPRARALLGRIAPNVVDGELRADIELALDGADAYRSLR